VTQNLYKLSKNTYTKTDVLFIKQEIRSPFGYNIKSIFKNDKVNGSIFEDGLTSYLGASPILA